MNNPREYGQPPFRIAVIHGGPGAAGEMAPVAAELSSTVGVLEPLQTALTLEGQIEELQQILERHAALPALLIGFSWGAWLAWMLAARQPRLVRKLVLVSSPGFESGDAFRTQAVRWSRLAVEEKEEVKALADILQRPAAAGQDAALARLGVLLTRADGFDPLPDETPVEIRANIFTAVWKQADAFRSSGGLLALGQAIRCPVVAIQGENDPHPGAGVEKPLAGLLKDFRFISLPRCGHKPWIERQARTAFFTLLRQETVFPGVQN